MNGGNKIHEAIPREIPERNGESRECVEPRNLNWRCRQFSVPGRQHTVHRNGEMYCDSRGQRQCYGIKWKG